jgi:hypothetical protein
VEHQELQTLYGGWLATLHPAAWEEVETMAGAAGRTLRIDLQPVIQKLGVQEVIRQMGVDRVIEQIGTKELVKRIGIDEFLAQLSSAERRELKRRLE